MFNEKNLQTDKRTEFTKWGVEMKSVGPSLAQWWAWSGNTARPKTCKPRCKCI